MKTIFIPVRDITPLPALSKLLPLLKSCKSVSITCTVQFSHRVSELATFLKSKGFVVHECKPVLGCRTSLKPADAVVLITTGVFHAINIALSTDARIIIVNPRERSIKLFDKKLVRAFRKKQAVRIHKALNSKVFGILVSKKPGQHNIKLARKIQKILEAKNCTAVILVADELSPLHINNFTEFDCFINTACPRLVEDDFAKPVVNWPEIESYFQ